MYLSKTKTIILVPSRYIHIDSNARWAPNAITIAPIDLENNPTNGLRFPNGLYVDENQIVYVADRVNSRIVACTSTGTNMYLVAGAKEGSEDENLLGLPVDVIVDEQTDSLIISDIDKRRIIRWPRQNGKSAEILISDITCTGLAMDADGLLYVSDKDNHNVKRYRIGDSEGTIVAGGDWIGYGLDRLYSPSYLVVDEEHSVYVSDFGNHRVVKWIPGATEGILIAGGHDAGNDLTQFSCPNGIVLDQMGTIYVADSDNNRVVRWRKGATEGEVIAGGNGAGEAANQLSNPAGLSFDKQGNLYVADFGNYRVQKFPIQINA